MCGHTLVNKAYLKELEKNLQDAASHSDFKEAISRFCRQIEVAAHLYLHRSAQPDSDTDALILTSLPDAWMAKHGDQLKASPKVLSSPCGLPQDWKIGTAFSKGWRTCTQLIKSSQSFGAGMTVCIGAPPGPVCHWSVADQRSQKEWAGFLHKIRGDLLLAAHLIHCRLQAHLISSHPINHPPSLSAQETACLYWVSTGKTMDETARVLGLKERTIRMHLSSARLKLGARNTVEAVAMMIRSGGL